MMFYVKLIEINYIVIVLLNGCKLYPVYLINSDYEKKKRQHRGIILAFRSGNKNTSMKRKCGKSTKTAMIQKLMIH